MAHHPWTMSRDAIRRIVAFVAIVAACPAALFGGALAGCAAQGFSPDCALSGILISPPLLLAAGVLAGVLTRGWSGLLLVAVGVVVGMVVLYVIAVATGSVLPFDPVQGLIAAIWFLGPVAAGYGIARAGARLIARPARTPARPKSGMGPRRTI
jgi:hypothetical protein